MSRFKGSQGFAVRRPAKDARQLRAEWFSAIELGGRLARVAEAESEPGAAGFGLNVTLLRVALRDLGADNFPIATSSAQCIAAAWLRLARDFVSPAWSAETRTACAAFFRAGGECLDALLSSLRAEEAHVGRRVMGERDED